MFLGHCAAQQRFLLETIVQQCCLGQVPTQVNYVTIWYLDLSSFTGTRARRYVDDAKFRLSSRPWTPDWLDQKTDDCFLITNQSEAAHTPWSPPPKFCVWKISIKPTGEFRTFELESLVLLISWPCNKTFSAPNSVLSVFLTSICVRYQKLGLTSISLHLVPPKPTNVIKFMGLSSCNVYITSILIYVIHNHLS